MKFRSVTLIDLNNQPFKIGLGILKFKAPVSIRSSWEQFDARDKSLKMHDKKRRGLYFILSHENQLCRVERLNYRLYTQGLRKGDILVSIGNTNVVGQTRKNIDNLLYSSSQPTDIDDDDEDGSPSIRHTLAFNPVHHRHDLNQMTSDDGQSSPECTNHSPHSSRVKYLCICRPAPQQQQHSSTSPALVDYLRQLVISTYPVVCIRRHECSGPSLTATTSRETPIEVDTESEKNTMKKPMTATPADSGFSDDATGGCVVDAMSTTIPAAPSKQNRKRFPRRYRSMSATSLMLDENRLPLNRKLITVTDGCYYYAKMWQRPPNRPLFNDCPEIGADRGRVIAQEAAQRVHFEPAKRRECSVPAGFGGRRRLRFTTFAQPTSDVKYNELTVLPRFHAGSRRPLEVSSENVKAKPKLPRWFDEVEYGIEDSFETPVSPVEYRETNFLTKSTSDLYTSDSAFNSGCAYYDSTTNSPSYSDSFAENMMPSITKSRKEDDKSSKPGEWKRKVHGQLVDSVLDVDNVGLTPLEQSKDFCVAEVKIEPTHVEDSSMSDDAQGMKRSVKSIVEYLENYEKNELNVRNKSRSSLGRNFQALLVSENGWQNEKKSRVSETFTLEPMFTQRPKRRPASMVLDHINLKEDAPSKVSNRPSTDIPHSHVAKVRKQFLGSSQPSNGQSMTISGSMSESMDDPITKVRFLNADENTQMSEISELVNRKESVSRLNENRSDFVSMGSAIEPHMDNFISVQRPECSTDSRVEPIKSRKKPIRALEIDRKQSESLGKELDDSFAEEKRFPVDADRMFPSIKSKHRTTEIDDQNSIYEVIERARYSLKTVPPISSINTSSENAREINETRVCMELPTFSNETKSLVESAESNEKSVEVRQLNRATEIDGKFDFSLEIVSPNSSIQLRDELVEIRELNRATEINGKSDFSLEPVSTFSSIEPKNVKVEIRELNRDAKVNGNPNFSLETVSSTSSAQHQYISAEIKELEIRDDLLNSQRYSIETLSPISSIENSIQQDFTCVRIEEPREFIGIVSVSQTSSDNEESAYRFDTPRKSLNIEALPTPDESLVKKTGSISETDEWITETLPTSYEYSRTISSTPIDQSIEELRISTDGYSNGHTDSFLRLHKPDKSRGSYPSFEGLTSLRKMDPISEKCEEAFSSEYPCDTTHESVDMFPDGNSILQKTESICANDHIVKRSEEMEKEVVRKSEIAGEQRIQTFGTQRFSLDAATLASSSNNRLSARRMESSETSSLNGESGARATLSSEMDDRDRSWSRVLTSQTSQDDRTSSTSHSSNYIRMASTDDSTNGYKRAYVVNSEKLRTAEPFTEETTKRALSENMEKYRLPLREQTMNIGSSDHSAESMINDNYRRQSGNGRDWSKDSGQSSVRSVNVISELSNMDSGITDSSTDDTKTRNSTLCCLPSTNGHDVSKSLKKRFRSLRSVNRSHSKTTDAIRLQVTFTNSSSGSANRSSGESTVCVQDNNLRSDFHQDQSEVVGVVKREKIPARAGISSFNQTVGSCTALLDRDLPTVSMRNNHSKAEKKNRLSSLSHRMSSFANAIFRQDSQHLKEGVEWDELADLAIVSEPEQAKTIPLVVAITKPSRIEQEEIGDSPEENHFISTDSLKVKTSHAQKVHIYSPISSISSDHNREQLDEFASQLIHKVFLDVDSTRKATMKRPLIKTTPLIQRAELSPIKKTEMPIKIDNSSSVPSFLQSSEQIGTPRTSTPIRTETATCAVRYISSADDLIYLGLMGCPVGDITLLRMRTGLLYVVKSSPRANFALMNGDLISKVNSRDVTKMSLDEIVHMFRSSIYFNLTFEYCRRYDRECLYRSNWHTKKAIKMSYTSTSAAAAATGDDKQSSPAPTAPPNAPVQSPKSTYSYKSNITPRSTMVQRRSGATGISGQLPQMMTRVSHSVVSGPSGYAPSSSSAYGTLSSLVSAGVPMRPRGTGGMVALNETREREKRELSLLNDKFAQYVEKVRFLEAQNKKLQLELEALQNKAGQGSSRIKEMYEIEMQEARKLIDDTGRDRADAEVKAREAEQEASQLKKRYQDALASRSSDRQQIDAIEQEIAENEAKINLLRRRLTDIEDEGRRFKAESQRLINEISRLGNELQNESFAKSTLEAEKMGLEDELNMLRQMHEAELNDMRSKTVVDVGLDPSHFFRNELANAIREIRAEYENATEQQRSELHNRYMMHYNELVMRHQRPELDPNQYEQHRLQEQKLQVTLKTTRNESAHMKARNEQLAERIREIQSMLENEKDEGERLVRSREKELSDLKSRLDELLKEYDDVSNTKTSLEKEISQYRELLEGTMNRDGLRQVVEHIEEEARKLESERLTNAITSGPSLYSSSSSTRYITSPMGQGVGSAVSSLGGLGGGNTKPSAYSRTYQTPKDLN